MDFYERELDEHSFIGIIPPGQFRKVFHLLDSCIATPSIRDQIAKDLEGEFPARDPLTSWKLTFRCWKYQKERYVDFLHRILTIVYHASVLVPPRRKIWYVENIPRMIFLKSLEGRRDYPQVEAQLRSNNSLEKVADELDKNKHFWDRQKETKNHQTLQENDKGRSRNFYTIQENYKNRRDRTKNHPSTSQGAKPFRRGPMKNLNQPQPKRGYKPARSSNGAKVVY